MKEAVLELVHKECLVLLLSRSCSLCFPRLKTALITEAIGATATRRRASGGDWIGNAVGSAVVSKVVAVSGGAEIVEVAEGVAVVGQNRLLPCESAVAGKAAERGREAATAESCLIAVTGQRLLDQVRLNDIALTAERSLVAEVRHWIGAERQPTGGVWIRLKQMS